MKFFSFKFGVSVLLFLAVSAIALVPVRIAAQAERSVQLDYTELKALIKNLGYDAKDLSVDPGKEKLTFTVKTESHNIPIGAEISPSKNYVWLTVNLGDSKQMTNFSDRASKLLRQNALIQPNFFYLNSTDMLMLAVAADNRSIGSMDMKRLIDKLVKDVQKTADLWTK